MDCGECPVTILGNMRLTAPSQFCTFSMGFCIGMSLEVVVGLPVLNKLEDQNIHHVWKPGSSLLDWSIHEFWKLGKR